MTLRCEACPLASDSILWITTHFHFTGLHIYFNLPPPKKNIRITWDQIRDQRCWAEFLIPDYSVGVPEVALQSSHICMVQVEVITQKARGPSFKKMGSQLSSRGPLSCRNVCLLCTDLMKNQKQRFLYLFS